VTCHPRENNYGYRTPPPGPVCPHVVAPALSGPAWREREIGEREKEREGGRESLRERERELERKRERERERERDREKFHSQSRSD
jgi:hypothetical protein